jgi:hypothetical protein
MLWSACRYCCPRLHSVSPAGKVVCTVRLEPWNPAGNKLECGIGIRRKCVCASATAAHRVAYRKDPLYCTITSAPLHSAMAESFRRQILPLSCSSPGSRAITSTRSTRAVELWIRSRYRGHAKRCMYAKSSVVCMLKGKCSTVDMLSPSTAPPWHGGVCHRTQLSPTRSVKIGQCA